MVNYMSWSNLPTREKRKHTTKEGKASNDYCFPDIRLPSRLYLETIMMLPGNPYTNIE